MIPSRNDPPRVRAVRSLRELITSGTLSTGDALPSERALSIDMQVSRASLRWALGCLEQEGLIRKSGPRTRIVADRPDPDGLNGPISCQCVAVLAPRHDFDNPNVASGWSTRIAYGASRALSRLGYAALSVGNGNYREEDVDLLLRAKPVGVLVPELWDANEIRVASMRRLTDAGIPVVVYTGRPDFIGFDRVCSDHAAGCRELTRYFIHRGCRQPIMVWPDPGTEYWFAGRQRGYQDAMGAADLPAVPPIVFQMLQVDTTTRRGFTAMAHYLTGVLLPYFKAGEAEPPDALLLHTDGLIAPVAAALRLLGRTPNQDVRIGGYDNYWSFVSERLFDSTPPLATVDKQNTRLGEELVALLFDRIQGRLPPEPQTRVIPPQLVTLEEYADERAPLPAMAV